VQEDLDMATRKNVKAKETDLCHVGPGTPGGELFRRYWLAISRLEDLKDIPQAVNVLGEELVLFRDGQGRMGLMVLHCSHRGTSLEYGDIDESGIRCPYHGWLYDVSGNCLEQPLEPTGSTFCQKVKHPAYPVRELGGLIFAYMGPDKSDPPPLPRYSALVREGGTRLVLPPRHWDFNWFNFFENVVDSLHAYVLHQESRSDRSWENAFWRYRGDHHIDAVPSEFGLHAIVRWPGPAPESDYVRMTTVALPTVFSLGGRGEEDVGYERLLFVTPNDDNNFMVYTSDFIPGDGPHPIGEREKARRAAPSTASVKDYDKRKHMPFRGQVWKEDYVCQSTQGNVGYRRESLASSDRAIILLRKLLLEAIDTVRAGGTPRGVIPRSRANDMINLEAYRAVLSKPEVQQLLNGQLSAPA
jgi:phenylpropionate dioxygenase-like ring-hydroxylating dioxygenase large terminal subunit